MKRIIALFVCFVLCVGMMNVSVDELHRIIKSDDQPNKDFDVNITPEVISVLESYGYKVIRPDEK